MYFSGPSLVAVATGIVGSAWASGAIASISLIASPAAKAVPQTTAQVWSEIYARGASIMPKIGAVVALSLASAAYDVCSRGGRWGGFAAAAACSVSIVPFTLIVMRETNSALHQAARDRERADEHVSSLLKTWNMMNLTRALLPLTGTVLAVKALLDNMQ